jgi:hypothetical protein
MSKEEEYNDIFRDKLDARVFEATENSWQNALSVLEQNDKKKKRGFIWIWFLIGTGLLSGGIFLLKTFSPTGKTELIVTENKIQDTRTVVQENEIAKKTAHEKIEVAKETAPVTESKEAKTEKIEAKKSEASINENTNAKAGKKEHDLKKTAELKNTVVKNEKITRVLAIGIKPEKNKQGPTDQNRNASAAKDKNDPGKVKSPDAAAEEPKVIPATAFTPSETSVDTAQKTILTTVVNPKETKDSVSAVVKTDTVSTTKIEDKKAEEKKSLAEILHKKWTLDIAAGALVNSQFPHSFNSAGLGVGSIAAYYFHPNIGLASGLLYHSFTTDQQDTKSFVSTKQDFGYTNNVTAITVTKYKYLAIPVYLVVRFGKLELLGGAQYAQLLNTVAKVSTYQESYGSVTNEKESTSAGYTNGIRKNDLSMSLRCQYGITRKLFIGGGADFGMFDVKDNTYFGANKFNRNNNFQLFIKFRLAEK